MTEMDLAKLKSQRAGYRSVVTRILAQEVPTDPSDRDGLLAKVERYIDILNSIDCQVQGQLNDDLIEADVVDCCEIQDKLVALRSKVCQTQKSEADSVSFVSGSGGQVRVKLPKLELRPFDGDPLEWTAFWDTFDSSVNSNDCLKAVDKFSYLKGFLTGPAASTIAGFSVSNANYESAVELLKERFGQKRIVVNAHIEALIAIPQAGTSAKLRQTFDEAERHIRGLEALGVTADTYGIMMAPILLSKIPPDVRLVISRAHGESPWDLDMLRKQLKIEIEARERSNAGDMKAPRQESKSDSRMTAGSLVTAAKTKQCAFCGDGHASFECRLDVDSRWEKAKAGSLCFVCLRNNHRVSKCRFKRRCSKCHGMHHISLCSGKGYNSSGSSSTKPNHDNDVKEKAKEFPKTVGLSVHAEPFESKANCQTLLLAHQSVLMQTATVQIRNNRGSTKVRVLFDSGSQRSFITKKLVDRLGLEYSGEETMSIAAFNSTKTQTTAYKVVDVDLQCLDRSYCSISAAVVPSITSPLYKACLNAEDVERLKDLHLADTPYEIHNFEVELLIGLDHYWQLVEGSVLKLPNGPTAVKSVFGWLVSGIVNDTNTEDARYGSLLTGYPALDSQLQKFWDLESIGVCEMEKEKPDVLQKFNDTIEFDQGRYQVQFPWKEEFASLPDNKSLALKRFHGLLRRLKEDPSMKSEYANVIEDQQKRGFIEKVEDQEVSTGVVHYIPHHPVVRRDRATTKVRIVYDASARMDKHSPCLNDALHKGPDMLGDLFGMLIRFRKHKVALISDIEKAFLQVGLKENQRDCTRFFWIDRTDDVLDDSKVVVYRFSRVPFGVISSPFLLNATLQHHLKVKSEFRAAKLMKNSLYVDNVVLSVPNEDQGKQFYKEAKSLLSDAGMNLREWATNSEEVTSTISLEDRVKSSKLKVLGVTWDTVKDVLEFRGLPDPHSSKCTPTKRNVLQYISTTFDPLGLMSPVVILGKIFMQSLCSKCLEWDTPLPQDMAKEWSEVVAKLEAIKQVQVPRCLGLENGTNFELHAFADASLRAYATAVYLRFDTPAGKAASLLCSKTRVTPIKGCTLPRLELLAVLIAVRLSAYVTTQLDLKINKTYVWSDSQITLAWIRNTKPLKDFVANRVKEIRASKATFCYVPTKENPADLPSRGLEAERLINNDLWWSGPPWLRKDVEEWPQETLSRSVGLEFLKELKKDVLKPDACSLVAKLEKESCSLNCDKYSSLLKLLRVTAWCNRFMNNCRSRSDPIKEKYLMASELQKAELFWELKSQVECFTEEIQSLRKKKSTQLVRQLALFIDKDGLLRCRGRIANADVSEDQKYPKLLPKCHPLTRLIIRSVHEGVLHQGLRHTLSVLRQKYWIPKGRQVVKNVLNSCVTCKLWEGKPYRPPPAPDLPPLRVTESPPFSYVGVDYAGPLYVKGENKAWICLFTCAVTRAVHLELARNLTTYEFVLCLRRFISIRGTPRRIVSDNAKTFKLAKSMLDRLWSDLVSNTEVQDYVSKAGIRWVFNVERAPWWGGFFERMVGLVKRTLRKTVGKASLTFIELETQLSEVAAILNSRPLTYVYTALSDGNPLTPNDLCGLRNPSGFPPVADESADLDYVLKGQETAQSLYQRVKYSQKVVDSFWKAWRHEYLCQLKEYHLSRRSKASADTEPVVGSVVLIKASLPRAQWKLAIITKLLPGRDGLVRAAAVKVGKKVFQRPLQLLCPLEISNMDLISHPEFHCQENEEINLPKRKAAIEAMNKIKLWTQNAPGEDVVNIDN